jgi:peptidoglycan/LPS O-acetylase OafA/YrhL
MNYRGEIDGLRALAVMPVILFHAGFETFSGGFIGVDVFFVISGYLITKIILAELEQNQFSLVNFYERRARRILPALFLVMLVCIPFAWLRLLPSDIKDFYQSLVAVPIFASNVLFWRESGYFDVAAEFKPLLHTWSLAVEEQFYLLFPLFLILFWGLGKRRILLTLASVTIVSLAFAQFGAYSNSTAAFYLLPTRVWELLIGSFTGFYLHQINRIQFSRITKEIGALLGIFLISYSIFYYNQETPYPGFYALVPVIGTVCIIVFATQETLTANLIGNRVFVSIGLVSYSAYLWHQPIFAFARQGSITGPSNTTFLLLSILTLALSYVSWRYVEMPFRNRFTFTRKFVFFFSTVGTLSFICIGIAGIVFQEKITFIRFNEAQLQTIITASASPKRTACHFPQTESALNREPCSYFSNNVKVAVFGNSHATELAYSLANLLKDHGIGIVQHTMSGCHHNYNIDVESDSVCGRWHKKVVSNLIQDDDIEHVFLSYRNEGYLDNYEYRQSLANIANELSDSGKEVTLVLQVPMPIAHINQHLANNMADLSVSIPSRKLSDWKDLYGDSSKIITLLNKGVDVFDPADIFCNTDNDNCYVTKNGLALFFDDDHVSVDGANLIADVLVNKYLDLR